MLLPFTTLPPADERRFLYTYLGKRVVGADEKSSVFQSLYAYDGVRSRPAFVVGEGEQFLLNLALKDASCGRTVIFIDGEGKRETLDRLYYWCGYQLGKPVYALMPNQDELSHTWNPLLSNVIQPGVIAEFFFDTYRRFAGKNFEGKKIDEDDLDLQNEALTALFRALRGAEIVFHCGDAADFFENEEAFKQLEGAMRGDGLEYYDELKQLREYEDNFEDRMKPLIYFLRLFKSWTLSSYYPSIQLDRLISSGSVVYVGLPIGWDNDDERKLFCATGNLIIQHLRALISHTATSDREDRRVVSFVIKKTEAFLDHELVEWIGKMRASEVMMTCAVASIEDFKVMGEKFMTLLRDDTPNIALFHSSDESSVAWFADIWRQKRLQDGNEIGEEGAWAKQLEHLHAEQYLFESHACAERPMLLAVPMLPAPPSRPDYQYRRQHYNIEEKPTFRTRYSLIEEERTAIS